MWELVEDQGHDELRYRRAAALQGQTATLQGLLGEVLRRAFKHRLSGSVIRLILAENFPGSLLSRFEIGKFATIEEKARPIASTPPDLRVRPDLRLQRFTALRSVYLEDATLRFS